MNRVALALVPGAGFVMKDTDFINISALTMDHMARGISLEANWDEGEGGFQLCWQPIWGSRVHSQSRRDCMACPLPIDTGAHATEAKAREWGLGLLGRTLRAQSESGTTSLHWGRGVSSAEFLAVLGGRANPSY